MMALAVRAWVACFAVLLTAAPLRAQAVDTRATSVYGQVRAISEAADNEARRAVIVQALQQIGLAPELVWFDPPSARADRRGANIVADVSGSNQRVLLLGAHYDRVSRGHGVIDNGAGVAAVLHLADAFRRNPLTNHTVRVALFDLEENGLLGSRAMVADSLRIPLPATFLNFDVFGFGDAFWLGSVNPEGALVTALHEAAGAAELQFVVDSLYPPSDHLSFRGTSSESYSLSILDGPDIPVVLALMRGDRPAPASRPRIMGLIHTDDDTLDKLDSGAVARALEAVEQAIRRMDAQAAR